jgi:FkbM family methyltransferase
VDKLHRYFAQNGEDYILCTFFSFKEDGYFVDVGAFDGIHLSNSYCFELLGWRGVCVEPQKIYYELCCSNRPLSVCIHAACADSDAINEITISTDITGLFSGVNLDNEQKNIHEHYRAIGQSLADTKKEVVPATTLNALLTKHLPSEPVVDFISIDVEGFEKNVLEGLDLSKFAPRILLVETSTDEDLSTISEYLAQHGYTFARRVGPNSYFTTNQKDTETINNIELTCVVEKQIHPLGRNFTQQTFLDGKVIFKGKNGNSMLLNYEPLEKKVEELYQKVAKTLKILKEAGASRTKLQRQLDVIKHLGSNVTSLLDKIRKFRK